MIGTEIPSIAVRKGSGDLERNRPGGASDDACGHLAADGRRQRWIRYAHRLADASAGSLEAQEWREAIYLPDPARAIVGSFPIMPT
jgi:hypothetical protein